MAKLLLKLTRLLVVAIVRYKGETDIIYPAAKKRGVEALTLGFLLCSLVPAVRAQEVSGDESARTTSATSGTGNKERDCAEKIEGNSNKPLCIANKIESLRLGRAGRFARGFQYDYKLTQQPETVFANFETEEGIESRFIRNPQNYLKQHTLTFKFAELFPDSLSLFKAGSDYLKKHPQAAGNSEELSNIFCKGKPQLITCLAKGGSWWKRALIGTSININFSERTIIQQGFIASPIVFGQKYQVNPGFNFDPAKLFITAGSWKNAFDEVQKIDKGLALLGASDVKARRKPWRQPWAAALIPKVELKVLSRFDYVTIRGRLQQAPFRERALSNWTFTWDLTRAIPDTKSRIDADAAVQALSDLENNLGLVEEPTWKKQCHLYFGEEKEAGRKIKDVHPSLFTANSCYKLARNLKAKDYRLFCALKVKEVEKAEPVGSKKSSTQEPGSPQPNECGW